MNSNSASKKRESSANSAGATRPRSVSSNGGGKNSGRSFAETSATVISNIGNLINEV